MKITRITPVRSEIVELDEMYNGYTTYQRDGRGNWEVLMGESWEPVFNSAVLEKEYQRFIKKD